MDIARRFKNRFHVGHAFDVFVNCLESRAANVVQVQIWECPQYHFTPEQLETTFGHVGLIMLIDPFVSHNASQCHPGLQTASRHLPCFGMTHHALVTLTFTQMNENVQKHAPKDPGGSQDRAQRIQAVPGETKTTDEVRSPGSFFSPNSPTKSKA